MRIQRSTAAGSGAPLPPGTYDAEIMSAEDTMSRANKPMLKLVLRVAGRSTLYYYVPEHVGFRVDNLLDALGLDDLDTGALDLAGVKLRVEVEREHYQGEERAKVESLLPPSEADDVDCPF